MTNYVVTCNQSHCLSSLKFVYNYKWSAWIIKVEFWFCKAGKNINNNINIIKLKYAT